MIVAGVLIAGVGGAVIRFLVARAFASRPGHAAQAFPLAVLLVNVVGSALGGIVIALSLHAGLPDGARLVLLTGFCGGLTTFSTFGVETVQLVLDGRARMAVASVAANLALGVGAAAAAYAIVTALA